jgi:hypothetical protein
MIALNEETSEKYCLFVSLKSSQNGEWSFFHTAAFHAKCCKKTSMLLAESPLFKGVLKKININTNILHNESSTINSAFVVLFIFIKNKSSDKTKQHKNGRNNSGRAYEQIKNAKDITLNFSNVVFVCLATSTPVIITSMEKCEILGHTGRFIKLERKNMESIKDNMR